MGEADYSLVNKKLSKIDIAQKRKKATKAALLSIALVLSIGYVVGQVMVSLLGLPGRDGLYVFLDTLMGSVITIGVVGLFFLVRQAFIDFWPD